MASTMTAQSQVSKVKRKASSAGSSLEGNEIHRQIKESRLPSKKRKSSHDSAAVGQRLDNRKASLDSSGSSSQFPESHELSLAAVKLCKEVADESLNVLPNFKESSDASNFNDVLALGTTEPAIFSHDAGLLEVTTDEVMENIDALGSKTEKKDEGSDNSGATLESSQQRLLLEALLHGTSSQSGSGGKKEMLDSSGLRDRLDSFTFGRDRLDSFHVGRERPDSLPSGGRGRFESWGGMSDLSAGQHLSSDTAVAAKAHSAHQSVGVAEDSLLVAAASGKDLLGEESKKPITVPNGISVGVGRDRLNSVNSLSDGSLMGVDMSGDIQAFVAAAVNQVGEQLAEIVRDFECDSVELAPHEVVSGEYLTGSEGSSAVSPIIGATSDGTRAGACWLQSAVDYEAAAVAASIDLNVIQQGTMEAPKPVFSGPKASSGCYRHSGRRSLPLKRRGTTSTGSSVSDEETWGRDLKVAAYIPSLAELQRSENYVSMPIKKRAKRLSADLEKASYAASAATPKVSNKKAQSIPEITPYLPVSEPASVVGHTCKSVMGQAGQKWDSMFDCLLAYREDRRHEEVKGLPVEERDAWSWDGNVPTTYKTKDGKALGRWVNNQRSAKSKGSLLDDRIQRLEGAGLKWSVLASNSWEKLLEELKTYVKEQTSTGCKWDGNVPTNYQIKSCSGAFEGEDKNLGRWVNRQRSLYQAGKLKKERQLALEKIGLKWSMLATNSWSSMFEALLSYMEQCRTDGGTWDGNVPAHYRTDENPSRGLGRWINRQRSAHTRGKLRKEFADKLNEIGLKWNVHDRDANDRDEVVDDNSVDDLENTTKTDEEKSNFNKDTSQSEPGIEGAGTSKVNPSCGNQNKHQIHIDVASFCCESGEASTAHKGEDNEESLATKAGG